MSGFLDEFWRLFFARPPVDPPAIDPAGKSRIALGAALFRDPRLSGDGTRSCSSCHQPGRGFTDGRMHSETLDPSRMLRNAPSLWNVKWQTAFHWDGSARSLEAQAFLPLEGSAEMAADWPTVINRLSGDPRSSVQFAEAFPSAPEVSRDNITSAIAAYERTLVSPATVFDRWVGGDNSALSDAELAGFRLFVGRAGCIGCHAGWRFTDDSFHDIGIPGDDPGRGAVPGGVPGLRAFKTPGLRELASTAPYMHDGSLATLDDVLDHYTSERVNRGKVSSSLVRPLDLSPDERNDLIAFLNTLSSERPAP